MKQADIPLRAIFGLRANPDEDWAELHALQLSGLARGSYPRIGIVILLAMMTGLSLSRIVPGGLLLGWVGVNIFQMLIGLVRTRRGMADREPPTYLPQEVRTSSLHGVVMGLLWALCVPMILLNADNMSEMVFGLITFQSLALVLMLVLSTNAALVPSVAVIFNTIVGCSVMGAHYWLGYPILAFSYLAMWLPLSYLAVHSCIANVTLSLAEKRLDEKSETVSLLLREFDDAGADWLWQTDTGRRVIHVSPRFARALGREAREIEGQSIVEILAGDSWQSGQCPAGLHELADRLKSRRPFANLIVPALLDGKQHWWELSASPRYDEKGAFIGFHGVGSDATERYESQKKITRLARYDTLTGLPNRLQITETLGRSLEDAEKWGSRCCFMMIDLDRFKQVNDTLGHQVGDRLLAKVSKRLAQVVSENDLCGRLGGDEFAVVVKDVPNGEYVDMLADKIIEKLSRPYEIDRHCIYIGASIGSAVGPRDGKSVETVMRNADLALYRSKGAGRGVHNRYQSKLHAEAEERRLMENALRKALDADEFNIVYQPVVDARENLLIGFEALLRWNNPLYGDVPPARFVPLAEEAGLIADIGGWTLRQACRDAAQWPDPVRVAVNVSADQLLDRDFPAHVVMALRDAGLPAHRLEIEVTESIFLRDGGIATDTLDQLLALGVNLSMDDFGTGYSSLGYLRKTSFDTIKVDKSFVKGAARDAIESIAIIRALIAMADSLGIATTAEGVETEEELEMVRKLGCSKVQGYLFGRPMPLADTLLITAPALAGGSDMPVKRAQSIGI